MHRSLLASAALHIGAVAGLAHLSLRTELPPVAPPQPPSPYSTCFYPLVDARSLLAGASTSDVAGFIGMTALKVPEGDRATLCVHFNGDRTLELVLQDGRVSRATWAEDTATRNCVGHQVSVPRSAHAAEFRAATRSRAVPQHRRTA